MALQTKSQVRDARCKQNMRNAMKATARKSAKKSANAQKKLRKKTWGF